VGLLTCGHHGVPQRKKTGILRPDFNGAFQAFLQFGAVPPGQGFLPLGNIGVTGEYGGADSGLRTARTEIPGSLLKVLHQGKGFFVIFAVHQLEQLFHVPFEGIQFLLLLIRKRIHGGHEFPDQESFVQPFQRIHVMMGIHQVVHGLHVPVGVTGQLPGKVVQDSDGGRSAQRTAEHLGGIGILIQPQLGIPVIEQAAVNAAAYGNMVKTPLGKQLNQRRLKNNLRFRHRQNLLTFQLQLAGFHLHYTLFQIFVTGVIFGRMIGGCSLFPALLAGGRTGNRRHAAFHQAHLLGVATDFPFHRLKHLPLVFSIAPGLPRGVNGLAESVGNASVQRVAGSGGQQVHYLPHHIIRHQFFLAHGERFVELFKNFLIFLRIFRTFLRLAQVLVETRFNLPETAHIQRRSVDGHRAVLRIQERKLIAVQGLGVPLPGRLVGIRLNGGRGGRGRGRRPAGCRRVVHHLPQRGNRAGQGHQKTAFHRMRVIVYLG